MRPGKAIHLGAVAIVLFERLLAMKFNEQVGNVVVLARRTRANVLRQSRNKWSFG